MASAVRRSSTLSALRALSIALLILAMGDRAAHACSFGQNVHTLDPAEQAMDTQPPSTPVVGNLKIERGRGPQMQGCGSAVTSCDDIGTVSFTASATDDRTAAAMLGYRLAITRGQAPVDLLSSGQDVRGFSGTIFLKWLDGGTDDQEDLDFDLEVRAIDLGGNVSSQVTIVRVQNGLGGCHIVAGVPRSARTLGLVSIVLFTSALVLRRSRRRG